MLNNVKRGNGFGSIAPTTSRHVLEMTVISGEDLQIKGRPIDNNAYAVVRIRSQDNKLTKVDKQCGSYPYWNDNFLLDLPQRERFITVEVRRVRRRRSTNGEGKLIGGANIPVADFMGGYVPEGYLQFLSYRLRDASGDRNGIVNVSVRVRSALASGGFKAEMGRGIPIPIPIGGTRKWTCSCRREPDSDGLSHVL